MRRVRVQSRKLGSILNEKTGALLHYKHEEDGWTFARTSESSEKETWIASHIARTLKISPKGRADFDRWLKKLSELKDESKGDRPEFLPLYGGYWGFEVIRHWERELKLGSRSSWPDAEIQVVRDLSSVGKDGVWISSRSFDGDLSARELNQRLDHLERNWEKRFLVARDASSEKTLKGITPVFRGAQKREFPRSFDLIHEKIASGDLYQCVLSDRMGFKVTQAKWEKMVLASSQEKNPYFAVFRSGKKSILSQSPECLVRVENGTVQTFPIAGTRPRGKTKIEDQRFEKQMRTSPKEMAEHLMLVDLGRNDLGRICLPGSVQVEEFAKTLKLPRVQHMVSKVSGKLPKDLNGWDALRSAFPAGTLSGAPKLSAIQTIADLEASPRGPYGGAFVVADAKGNLDSCILIRSLFRSGEKAWIQAGAGIVFDSKARREYREIEHKTRRIRELLR